jgi:hypothetical protein
MIIVLIWHQPNPAMQDEIELNETLLLVWHNIGKDVTKKIVDSMQNQLNKMIPSKGYPTKY